MIQASDGPRQGAGFRFPLAVHDKAGSVPEARLVKRAGDMRAVMFDEILVRDAAAGEQSLRG